jgi:crotonobetainyl-CoA:carnitine CoA-transferase CaiB-like acyl-CoA transferase
VAADGKWLTIATTEDHFWQNLCRALGFEDWAADEELSTPDGRLEHAMRLLDRLEQTFLRRPRSEWLDLFEQHDVPAGPVHDAQGLIDDPHLNARGLIWSKQDASGVTRRAVGYPVQMSDLETSWRLMPP